MYVHNNIQYSDETLYNTIQNDRTNYKLIILIIASHSESYDLFERCWKSYMNSFPLVKSYLLYSDPDIENELSITSDTITHKHTECFVPGIFNKTIAGMAFCEQNFSYDYLLRTNLSSFYHIPRLLAYLEKQTRNNFVASQLYILPNHVSKVHEQAIVNKYLGKQLNDRFIFLHGAGFFLSKDVVTKFMNNLFNNSHENNIMLASVPDDVSIGLVLYNILTLPSQYSETSPYYPLEYVPIVHLKHQCSVELEDPRKIENPNIFHFRNKSDDSLNDNSIEARQNNIINYILQIRYFYDMPSFMEEIGPILLEEKTTKNIYALTNDFIPSKDNSIKPFISINKPIKIIDCVIFYNEIDMLLYRLTVLDSVVDYFIIVESTKTHIGKEKPLFYVINEEKFKQFSKKIIHIVVDDLIIADINKNEQWLNENKQRNAIDTGIKQLNLSNDDLIIISDVDEIPDPESLQQMKNNEIEIKFANMKQDFYYYNLNSLCVGETWLFPKIIAYDIYLLFDSSPQTIRMSHAKDTIDKGGWHLSYFGNVQFIKNKLQNFTHQEFNLPHIIDENMLKTKIENFDDILQRPNTSIRKIPIKENTYLPPLYDTFLKDFIVL